MKWPWDLLDVLDRRTFRRGDSDEERARKRAVVRFVIGAAAGGSGTNLIGALALSSTTRSTGHRGDRLTHGRGAGGL
eukprot:gene30903-8053_t